MGFCEEATGGEASGLTEIEDPEGDADRTDEAGGDIVAIGDEGGQTESDESEGFHGYLSCDDAKVLGERDTSIAPIGLVVKL